MTPLVSCICPTYARYPDFGHLLEEAVESYRLQDYPNKELLILNDCGPPHLLFMDTADAWTVDEICTTRPPPRDSGVRIFNFSKRFSSLGAKYNAGIQLARGSLVCVWEDDDISLPYRISQAVEKLGDMDYWKPSQVFFLQKDQPPLWRHNIGVRHHASVFRKSAWEKVRGYPLCSGAQDMIFDSLLTQQCRHAIPPPNPEPWKDLPVEAWQYIYRWGYSDCHISGRADHDNFYAEWGRRPVTPGRFEIRPHWRTDYVELTRKALPHG